jgi:hypothetical protein
MNPNRQRAILAAQKVKPQPLPDDFILPKLTAEQRREIYAPKPAASSPKELQGAQWVKGWKTAAKITYGATALLGIFFGGVIAKESKKGFRG